MKILFRIGLLVFLFLFIVLQFFHGERPEVTPENPGDIGEEVSLSVPLTRMLRTACYDCHSNETDYPWYSKVVPVSWWLIDHVEEGREHLNFSEWTSYDEDRKHHKLEELIEMIEEEAMPLPSYTIIHRDAILSDEDRDELVSWAKSYMQELEPGD